MPLTRRHFVASAMIAATFPQIARGARPRIVIIGAGAGGATVARRLANDSGGLLEIIVVEPRTDYYSCFFSNLYLADLYAYEALRHSYDQIKGYEDIVMIHDRAIAVDRASRSVKLASGGALSYDRLVLSPGIMPAYDRIPGYSSAALEVMPHAWETGSQVPQLKAQIEAMPSGGVFILVPPPDPSRCPPAPYERVSMIADIFTRRNPRAKIIILDTKNNFVNSTLFYEGWDHYYSGMIEWIAADVHGGILNVDAATMTITTELGDFEANAISLIPPQRAADIARTANLTAGDWVPIDPHNMRSRADPHIYVIGDASAAAAMPKSAYAANSQAGIVADQIRAELLSATIPAVRYANRCWSFIAGDDAISVGADYLPGDERIDVEAVFSTQVGESSLVRKNRTIAARQWYRAITADMMG